MHFINSRSMALTLALATRDDDPRRQAPYRGRRRVRRTRDARATMQRPGQG